jgi:hypothetical protein
MAHLGGSSSLRANEICDGRIGTVQYRTKYGTIHYSTDVPYVTVQWVKNSRRIGKIKSMKTCSFLGAGLSPREVRTGYDGTQPENCGFLC